MNIEYYTNRLKVSLAAAKAAVEPTSRIAHEGMAKAYRKILDGLLAPLERAKRKVRPESRDTQLGRALDQWENEGGGNPK
jgi:hypothetical protein